MLHIPISLLAYQSLLPSLAVKRVIEEASLAEFSMFASGAGDSVSAKAATSSAQVLNRVCRDCALLDALNVMKGQANSR